MSFDPFNLFSLPADGDSISSDPGALDGALTMEEIPLQRIGLDSHGRLQIIDDFLLQLDIADTPEDNNEDGAPPDPFELFDESVISTCSPEKGKEETRTQIISPETLQLNTFGAKMAVMPSLQTFTEEETKKLFDEPIRDRDKDYRAEQHSILISRKDAQVDGLESIAEEPGKVLKPGKYAINKAISPQFWSMEFQTFMRRQKILRTFRYISESYCVIDLYGVGINGSMFRAGGVPGRYLILEVYSQWCSKKHVIVLTLPELRKLFQDNPEMLKVGHKQDVFKALVDYLYFEYTIEPAHPATAATNMSNWASRPVTSMTSLSTNQEGAIDPLSRPMTTASMAHSRPVTSVGAGELGGFVLEEEEPPKHITARQKRLTARKKREDEAAAAELARIEAEKARIAAEEKEEREMYRSISPIMPDVVIRLGVPFPEDIPDPTRPNTTMPVNLQHQEVGGRPHSPHVPTLGDLSRPMSSSASEPVFTPGNNDANRWEHGAPPGSAPVQSNLIQAMYPPRCAGDEAPPNTAMQTETETQTVADTTRTISPLATERSDTYEMTADAPLGTTLSLEQQLDTHRSLGSASVASVRSIKSSTSTLTQAEQDLLDKLLPKADYRTQVVEHIERPRNIRPDLVGYPVTVNEIMRYLRDPTLLESQQFVAWKGYGLPYLSESLKLGQEKRMSAARQRDFDEKERIRKAEEAEAAKRAAWLAIPPMKRGFICRRLLYSVGCTIILRAYIFPPRPNLVVVKGMATGECKTLALNLPLSVVGGFYGEYRSPKQWPEELKIVLVKKMMREVYAVRTGDKITDGNVCLGVRDIKAFETQLNPIPAIAMNKRVQKARTRLIYNNELHWEKSVTDNQGKCALDDPKPFPPTTTFLKDNYHTHMCQPNPFRYMPRTDDKQRPPREKFFFSVGKLNSVRCMYGLYMVTKPLPGSLPARHKKVQTCLDEWDATYRAEEARRMGDREAMLRAEREEMLQRVRQQALMRRLAQMKELEDSHDEQLGTVNHHHKLAREDFVEKYYKSWKLSHLEFKELWGMTEYGIWHFPAVHSIIEQHEEEKLDHLRRMKEEKEELQRKHDEEEAELLERHGHHHHHHKHRSKHHHPRKHARLKHETGERRQMLLNLAVQESGEDQDSFVVRRMQEAIKMKQNLGKIEKDHAVEEEKEVKVYSTYHSHKHDDGEEKQEVKKVEEEDSDDEWLNEENFQTQEERTNVYLEELAHSGRDFEMVLELYFPQETELQGHTIQANSYLKVPLHIRDLISTVPTYKELFECLQVAYQTPYHDKYEAQSVLHMIDTWRDVVYQFIFRAKWTMSDSDECVKAKEYDARMAAERKQRRKILLLEFDEPEDGEEDYDPMTAEADAPVDPDATDSDEEFKVGANDDGIANGDAAIVGDDESIIDSEDGDIDITGVEGKTTNDVESAADSEQGEQGEAKEQGGDGKNEEEGEAGEFPIPLSTKEVIDLRRRIFTASAPTASPFCYTVNERQEHQLMSNEEPNNEFHQLPEAEVGLTLSWPLTYQNGPKVVYHSTVKVKCDIRPAHTALMNMEIYVRSWDEMGIFAYDPVRQLYFHLHEPDSMDLEEKAEMSRKLQYWPAENNGYKEKEDYLRMMLSMDILLTERKCTDGVTRPVLIYSDEVVMLSDDEEEEEEEELVDVMSILAAQKEANEIKMKEKEQKMKSVNEKLMAAKRAKEEKEKAEREAEEAAERKKYEEDMGDESEDDDDDDDDDDSD